VSIFIPPRRSHFSNSNLQRNVAKMAWRADYDAWAAALLQHGLPATIRGVELLPPWNGDRLLAITVDIDENDLPRTHEARGFCLHITLLFESELTDDLARAALQVHQRWSGRQVVLRVAWLGSGGAAFLDSADPLAADADVSRLHSAGHYADRGLHVSL
jgi:hypothetical protein